MELRSQVLLVDFLLATLGTILGILGGGLSFSIANAVIVCIGIGTFTPMVYVAEHRNLLTFLDTHRPLSFVIISIAIAVMGILLFGGRALTVAPWAALLVGMGVGFFWYRFYFGVLRPIPERRLQQARLFRGDPSGKFNP